MKNKPVENLQQVRFKLAEKWAAYENDEITDKEAILALALL